MDYSILTGLSATTPTLLDGCTEKNVSEGWDTFSGEFVFPVSAETNCKARLACGQTVPGYSACYIVDNSFKTEGLAVIAQISGMGFIQATTYRMKYSGGSGDANFSGYATNDAGQFAYYKSQGVGVTATEWKIITTSVPFDLMSTNVNPPRIPSMLPADPSWMPTPASWYLDDIQPTPAGQTVNLCEITYHLRSDSE